MKPLLMGTLALFAFIDLPCATGAGIGLGTPSIDDLANAGAKAQQAQKAKDDCKKSGHMAVAYQEERAIGGAVTAKFIMLSRSAVVDTPSDKLADVEGKDSFEVPDTEKNKLEKYVNKVGWKMASLSSRPSIAWTFGVIDADEANAYSAPGGYVLITTGMLKKLDNEAQLAGVLAHEITHVVEAHGIKAYQEMKTDECTSAVNKGFVASAAGDVVKLDFGLSSSFGYIPLDEMVKAGGAEALAAAVSYLGKGVDAITKNGYAQADEYVADGQALRLLTLAGYDSGELAKVIAKIDDSKGFLPSHASNKERLANLARNVNKPLAEGDFGYSDKPAAPALPPEITVVKK